MKLSIIVPIYNEAANIHRVLEIVRGVALPDGIDATEIILVDDGSIDGTAELLNAYRGQSGFVVHTAPQNAGKGSAVRIGLSYVTGDIVIIQDADLEYDPADYAVLLGPLVRGEARVVYGSRFLGRTFVPGMKAPYWLANKILKSVANLLYGSHLTDEATAYKVFRADLIKSLPLESKGFELCPELTAKVLKLGEEIHEVPICYRGRSKAEGKKIRAQDAWIAVWTLLKYRVRD